MRSQNDGNVSIYKFDDYRLDVAKRLVIDPSGHPIALKAKAFETLVYLVRNPGRVVERDEIMDAVWPGTAVEENNLTQHISALRRALGETKDDHRFIVTVPGHGYKFAAEVTEAGKGGFTRSYPAAPGHWWRFLALATGAAATLLLVGFLFRPGATAESFDRIGSIAVLPFKPISDEDRNSSFENGMTSDLITKLERSEGVLVRPFQAVKRFSSGETDPVAAGQDLGVDAVLETTVQFSEQRVRIVAKLIKVENGRPIWSQPFEGDRTDLFELQDKLTEKVASALMIKLSGDATKHYTNNVEAYELYLDGRHHLLNLEHSQAMLGIAKFEQAIEVDPNYALAYVGIARGYLSLALSSELAPQEMGEKSFAAAEKAVGMDPQLAEAHAMLGAANFWFKHDWAASEASLMKALDLEPKSAFARLYYAVLLGNTGRIDEALAQSKEARELDGFSAYSASMQGTTLIHAGRPQDALERFTEAARLNPRLWTPHCKAALALIDQHRYDEAVASAQKAAALNDKQTNSIAYEIYALAKLGRVAEAKRRLDHMLKLADRQYVPPYHIAVAYAGLGDRRNALTWLEKAFSDSDPKIVFIRSERFWTEYRAEPRYVELLKRMNLDNAP